jgi:hypothetical protein
MSRNFEAVLEECLAQIKAGQSLEDCLAKYPAYAEQLRPLLLMAQHMRAARIAPRLDAHQLGRERMLAAARQKAHAPPTIILRPVHPLHQLARQLSGAGAYRVALGLFMALIVSSLLTVTASAGALPGDPLYQVKLAWEDVRLVFALQEQAREEIAGEIQLERRSEIQSMIQQRRTGEVEFEGELSEIGEKQAKVGDFQLSLSTQTRIENGIQAGQLVRVRLQVLNNGELSALAIQTATGYKHQQNQVEAAATQTPTAAGPGPMGEPVQPTQAGPGIVPTQSPGSSNTPHGRGPQHTPTSLDDYQVEPTEHPANAPTPTGTPAPQGFEGPEATPTPKGNQNGKPEDAGQPSANYEQPVDEGDQPGGQGYQNGAKGKRGP